METAKESFMFHMWPGWAYIVAYAGTGALAGLSQAPIEYAFSRVAPEQHTLLPRQLGHAAVANPGIPSPQTFASGPLPTLVLRASLRFAAFGQFLRIRHVKRAMGTNRWPRWLDVAASGGAAGMVEAVVANRAADLRAAAFPHWTVLFRHPAKLFCCFGTYGFLSSRWAERQACEQAAVAGEDPEAAWTDTTLPSGPPKPFVVAWAMGVTAGAVGTTIMGAVEGIRPAYMIRNLIPRGALGIGTLIAVQVTSVDAVIKHYGI